MYIKEKLEEFVKKSTSLADILRLSGKRASGGNYKTLHYYIKSFDIDISKLSGKAWNRGISYKKSPKYTTEEILVENSPFRSTTHLRNRLIKEGIKQRRCDVCKLEIWNKKLIPIEIHHKNGMNLDNRLENILFLCPNCHAQTDNYRDNNQRRSSALSEIRDVEWRKFREASLGNPPIGNPEPSLSVKIKKGAETRHATPKSYGKCLVCQITLYKKNRKYCSYKCHHSYISSRIPSKEDILLAFSEKKNFLQVGKFFGVSDNAVRKWCTKYNIMSMVKV